MRSRAGDPNVGLQFEGEQWTWAEVEREMEVRAAFLEDLLRTGPPHVGRAARQRARVPLPDRRRRALGSRRSSGINPTRRGDELARDIRHADCQAIVTDTGYAALLDGLDLGAATGRVIIADAPEHEATLARYRGPDAPTITAVAESR